MRMRPNGASSPPLVTTSSDSSASQSESISSFPSPASTSSALSPSASSTASTAPSTATTFSPTKPHEIADLSKTAVGLIAIGGGTKASGSKSKASGVGVDNDPPLTEYYISDDKPSAVQQQPLDTPVMQQTVILNSPLPPASVSSSNLQNDSYWAPNHALSVTDHDEVMGDEEQIEDQEMGTFTPLTDTTTTTTTTITQLSATEYVMSAASSIGASSMSSLDADPAVVGGPYQISPQTSGPETIGATYQPWATPSQSQFGAPWPTYPLTVTYPLPFPHILSTMPSPYATTLVPETQGLIEMLRHWKYLARDARCRGTGYFCGNPDVVRAIEQLSASNNPVVKYEQLQGDDCDLQGINWRDIGVTRSQARTFRQETYENYVSQKCSDIWHPSSGERLIPSTDTYYRFNQMVGGPSRLLHFQLRNILAAASSSQVFYPTHGGVKMLDPATGSKKMVMAFPCNENVQISTLAATEDVLVVGGLNGDYHYRNLWSSGLDDCEGRLTSDNSGITNHVQIHSCRSTSSPLAAFSSNDKVFRLVDLETNKLVSQHEYAHPANCSAISSDQRLRVMVGDHEDVLITDAETGEIVQTLSGHRDHGFACDWAPDGWTVATGYQDRSIRIWDARMWTNSIGEGRPIAVLRTELAGVRSLRFSPLGSGKRILVGAEEVDYLNIINAQTFESKQTVDVFGEIGGTCFTNGGRDLMALVCDRSRGGLLQLDRCDKGMEDYDLCEHEPNSRTRRSRRIVYDWKHNPDEVLGQSGFFQTYTSRRRDTAVLGDLDPF